MKKETDPIAETLHFLVVYNSERWTKSMNAVFFVFYTIMERARFCRNTLAGKSLRFYADLV
jgi:hypothetical protein